MSYCKLYIDVDMEIEELQNQIDEGIRHFFPLNAVDAVVFQNEHKVVVSNLQSATYPVDRSIYYVEIESESESEIGENEFKFGTANLIEWLRKKCEYVVASCKFEDYIAERTGWNWTLENPLPPQ